MQPITWVDPSTSNLVHFYTSRCKFNNLCCIVVQGQGNFLNLLSGGIGFSQKFLCYCHFAICCGWDIHFSKAAILLRLSIQDLVNYNRPNCQAYLNQNLYILLMNRRNLLCHIRVKFVNTSHWGEAFEQMTKSCNYFDQNWQIFYVEDPLISRSMANMSMQRKCCNLRCACSLYSQTCVYHTFINFALHIYYRSRIL